LESGTAVNTSPRLLARLADVLELSDESRTVLFRLAFPELSLGDRAFGTMKDLSGSIAPLRVAARRLWSATSESEVLLAGSEAVAGFFEDADSVGAYKRINPGQWEYPVFIGGEHLENAVEELNHTLTIGMTPAQIDEMLLYGTLTEPGQVGDRFELHRNISLKDHIDRTFASVGFGAANFFDGQIRSREGIEATIFAVYVDGERDFSELDRAFLGTLADLASLALSK
jgi:hypothetical protein